jgi:hypothetical protein
MDFRFSRGKRYFPDVWYRCELPDYTDHPHQIDFDENGNWLGTNFTGVHANISKTVGVGNPDRWNIWIDEPNINMWDFWVSSCNLNRWSLAMDMRQTSVDMDICYENPAQQAIPTFPPGDLIVGLTSYEVNTAIGGTLTSLAIQATVCECKKCCRDYGWLSIDMRTPINPCPVCSSILDTLANRYFLSSDKPTDSDAIATLDMNNVRLIMAHYKIEEHQLPAIFGTG